LSTYRLCSKCHKATNEGFYIQNYETDEFVYFHGSCLNPYEQNEMTGRFEDNFHFACRFKEVTI